MRIVTGNMGFLLFMEVFDRSNECVLCFFVFFCFFGYVSINWKK
jgi:hypothetical protein